MEFGCEIGIPPREDMVGTIPNINTRIVKKIDENLYALEIDAVVDISKMEIIGRPIRLSDVLLAIEKADLPMSIETDLEPEGLAIYYRMGDGEIIAVHWNLEKDSLEEQKEECIEFLHNLLKH